jgi:hypothetical protein
VETVAFPLEGGGQVFVRAVETDGPAGGVVTRGFRSEETVAQAGQTFESAMGTIRNVADAVLHQVVGLATPPHEVRVEFALELTAKAAAVVASAAATAQLHVELAWHPSQNQGTQR